MALWVLGSMLPCSIAKRVGEPFPGLRVSERLFSPCAVKRSTCVCVLQRGTPTMTRVKVFAVPVFRLQGREVLTGA